MRGRCVIAEHPGNQPSDCVDDGHTGNLAAGEHEVPQADLKVNAVFYESLVNALVVATHENQRVPLCQFFGRRLIESLALRRHHDRQRTFPIRVLIQNRFNCIEEWRCHQNHAGSAAVRGRVDCAMTVVSEVARVNELNSDAS